MSNNKKSPENKDALPTFSWEYRASVRVNDRTYPIEIYNCRQKVRIKADKTIVPFALDGPGHLICNLLSHS
ncbi:hypothetical protein [Roseofilum capinflatum]|uniref:Transposase n=1 Tax=Roseofilum capinflatum BLCC-M114 TaxID=3022440 RepID=A0ABT7B5Z4_9CYAN|nr:hypothetical protein [Roseofilum capinflatum]MDJ1174049.1 hypothetical protein [Roseofilum capinflatum BLCC-M114]